MLIYCTAGYFCGCKYLFISTGAPPMVLSHLSVTWRNKLENAALNHTVTLTNSSEPLQGLVLPVARAQVSLCKIQSSQTTDISN